MEKVTYRCPVCGSTLVWSSTPVSWNDAAQAWETPGPFDPEHGDCGQCDAEFHVSEAEVKLS